MTPLALLVPPVPNQPVPLFASPPNGSPKRKQKKLKLKNNKNGRNPLLVVRISLKSVRPKIKRRRKKARKAQKMKGRRLIKRTRDLRSPKLRKTRSDYNYTEI
jgi:hypothetical protein